MVRFTIAVPELGTVTYTPPDDIQEFFADAGPEVLRTAEMHFTKPLATNIFLLTTAFTQMVMEKGDGAAFLTFCADVQKALESQAEKLGSR